MVKSENLLPVVIFTDEIAMDLTWPFTLDLITIALEKLIQISTINFAPSL